MTAEAEKIYTWWFDAISIFLRYFIIAGIGYFIFYIWKYKSFAEKKIQEKNPAKKIIRTEISYSVFTLVIYCIVSWLIFYSQKSGITKIYLDIAQFGYVYFFISIIIMIVVHDAYFYWTHRLLHLPKVFKVVHRTHHLSHNPTPWAAFSFHPLEAIVSAGFIPIIVFFIPAHPFALFAFLNIMTLVNVMGHLGYETFPLQFRKSRLGKWQNTSTNHNIHHKYSKYNFGLYFTFWDRLMGTYHEKLRSNEINQQK